MMGICECVSGHYPSPSPTDEGSENKSEASEATYEQTPTTVASRERSSSQLPSEFQEPVIELDAKKWKIIASLFKTLFILPVLGHFLRGFSSPQMGFTYAQNDLIVLTLVYPILLVALIILITLRTL